jgi:hypothetical protein
VPRGAAGGAPGLGGGKAGKNVRALASRMSTGLGTGSRELPVSEEGRELNAKGVTRGSNWAQLALIAWIWKGVAGMEWAL